MNKIKQYRPAFIDCEDDNKEIIFNTTEELLGIDFVKNFSQNGNFYKYSISENHLMAEYENGYEWWVIGYINNPKEVNLPKWIPKSKTNV